MGQQVNVYRKLKLWPGAVVEGYMPDAPTTDYYVDDALGADTNGGNAWGAYNALLTIGAAMTKAATHSATLRGRARIFVAPGSYTENVVTPLNTQCPFGQLIAVNPTPRQSFGAAYIAPASGVGLTVKARGWLISGFEIDGASANKCVVLDGLTANCSAQGTEIANCLIVGQNVALAGIDVTGNGAPHSKIHDNGFYGFHSGSTAGTCLMCSESGTDQPRFWLVEDNWFGDSDNLLLMNPRGFKECIIRGNTLLAVGANYTASMKIDNRGGNASIFYKNYLGGTYTNGGGYWANAGGNDEWGGNYNGLTGGMTAADPTT